MITMNRISLIALMITSLLVLSMGCKSTSYSGFMRNNKAIHVDRPIFDIKGVRLSDSTVQLSFMTASTLRTVDRSIRYVDIFIGPDKDHLNDSIMVNPTMAGTPGSDETILFIGEGLWDTPAAKASRSAVAEVAVVTATDHLIFTTAIEYQKAEPVDLRPFATAAGDSAIDIGVMAKRIFVPQGEYLPTSESFRVLISDGKGSVVWRSDAGLAFLSVVTLVEPQNANAIHRYVMPWDGRDLGGQKVPDGEYHADLIIPSRPKSYSASISFSWPPR
ncbi:MAG: hypothetical protein IPI29_08210 [Ignavibacteria bacterium]|nr:hypothetical protein [Ignavibacteria bacterium]MBK7412522.1 hypothetical protein [Ignavibacteria bacterium]